MSEAAGAGSASTGGTGGADTGASTDNARATAGANGTTGDHGGTARAKNSWGEAGGKDYSQSDDQGQKQAPAQGQGDDDSEEISLGSTKAKVPKALAKSIKDLERASQERMRQAAEVRKAMQERDTMLDLLEKDPDKFAEMYERMKGKKLDFDTLSEERLAKKYELMQMTPEQRRLHELETAERQRQQIETNQKNELIGQLKDLLGESLPPGLERYPKEQIAAYLDQQRSIFSQSQQQLEQEFIDAWKTTNLPKNKYFGAQVAFKMLSHAKANAKNPEAAPLQAHEAAAIVKQEFQSHIRDVASQMEVKDLQALLGDEILQKLRSADVERVTAKTASQFGQKSPGNAQPASEQSKKQVNQIEWRKAMGLG